MFYEIIESLPDRAKMSALFSLAGSLNAVVLYKAQAIVNSCEFDGIDWRDEALNGFPGAQTRGEALGTAGPYANPWIELLAINTLRHELMGKLNVARNMAYDENQDAEALANAFKFITKEPKHIDRAALEAVAELLELDNETIDMIDRTDTMMQKIKREKLICMKESVISVALSIPSIVGCADDEAFNHLSDERQLKLYEKLENSLNTAMSQVVVDVLRVKPGARISDVPLIKAALHSVNVAVCELNGSPPPVKKAPVKRSEPAPMTNAEKRNASTAPGPVTAYKPAKVVEQAKVAKAMKVVKPVR